MSSRSHFKGLKVEDIYVKRETYLSQYTDNQDKDSFFKSDKNRNNLDLPNDLNGTDLSENNSPVKIVLGVNKT